LWLVPIAPTAATIARMVCAAMLRLIFMRDPLILILLRGAMLWRAFRGRQNSVDDAERIFTSMVRL